MFKEIMKMIEDSPLNINEIAKGADVGSRWLRMVVSEEIKEPGFSKLSKVKSFLESQTSES